MSNGSVVNNLFYSCWDGMRSDQCRGHILTIPLLQITSFLPPSPSRASFHLSSISIFAFFSLFSRFPPFSPFLSLLSISIAPILLHRGLVRCSAGITLQGIRAARGTAEGVGGGKHGAGCWNVSLIGANLKLACLFVFHVLEVIHRFNKVLCFIIIKVGFPEIINP